MPEHAPEAVESAPFTRAPMTTNAKRSTWWPEVTRSTVTTPIEKPPLMRDKGN